MAWYVTEEESEQAATCGRFMVTAGGPGWYGSNDASGAFGPFDTQEEAEAFEKSGESYWAKPEAVRP